MRLLLQIVITRLQMAVMVQRLLVWCVPRIVLIFLMSAGRMTNCAWWEEPLAQAMFTMVVTLSVIMGGTSQMLMLSVELLNSLVLITSLLVATLGWPAPTLS